MKLEAKLGDDGYPESKTESQPWVNITAYEAYDECASLNDKFGETNKFALMTNEEWMTVARQIETVPSNWIHPTNPEQNNVIGAGCLKQGNVGNTGDGCSYEGGSVLHGSSRNSLSEHKLATDESVRDLSGNTWEWVDFSKDAGLQFAPTSCDGWWQNFPEFSCDDFPSSNYLPTNGASTAYWGMGKIFGGSTGAILRGGGYTNYSNGGLYALNMNESPNLADATIGFRCVYRP